VLDGSNLTNITAAAVSNNSVGTAQIIDGTILGADMNFTGLNTATSNIVIQDSTGKFNNFGCVTAAMWPLGP